jgi:formamidopyrimidine-DNA glycosylase
MPELPEVEDCRMDLEAFVAGRTIARCEPADDSSERAGRRVGALGLAEAVFGHACKRHASRAMQARARAGA